MADVVFIHTRTTSCWLTMSAPLTTTSLSVQETDNR